MSDLSTYRHRLALALVDRPGHRNFVVDRCTLVVVAVVAVVVGLASVSGTTERPYLQFTEDGVVTAMSAIFLAMASALAIACFLLLAVRSDSRQVGSASQWFWLLMAVAFLFFSLDELLEFHEHIGALIRTALSGSPAGFRNWNDVIVIGYGLAALPILIFFLPEILRYSRVPELFGAGLFLYLVHTTFDALQRRPADMMWEESAKLGAAACFALGGLAALLVIASPSPAPPGVAGGPVSSGISGPSGIRVSGVRDTES